MCLGSIRGRRGSELKVLSAIETKMGGYFASVRDSVPRTVGVEVPILQEG